MAGNFIEVARMEDLPPGRMLRVTVGGHHYLLANVDGTVYAADDLCTHEDASLATGALHGACVSCPLHGSRFDLRTGRPLEEPATVPLKTYPVAVRGDAILLRPGK